MILDEMLHSVTTVTSEVHGATDSVTQDGESHHQSDESTQH